MTLVVLVSYGLPLTSVFCKLFQLLRTYCSAAFLDSALTLKQYCFGITAFTKYSFFPIILHFKDRFDRKRPKDVDDSIETLNSKTNKTPSYPSGHSAQSMLVAKYVIGKFPKHEKGLIEAAKECGIGRVLAGFHYLSDHVAGKLLGEKMYSIMNKDDYNA